MSTIQLLSNFNCARLPNLSAVLMIVVLGILINAILSDAILASSPQRNQINREFTLNSDTLLVTNITADDRLSINLGVIQSRLAVWYRSTRDRSEEPSTKIDLTDKWSLLPNTYWQWDTSTGDWWLTALEEATLDLPLDLAFIYQRSSVEPVINQEKIREDIQQQLNLRRSLKPDPFQLEQSGRITRGIVMGNNQQVSLESGLDIQLTGTIGDETQLSAILTDRNIPFQPDGTTQSIREFDQLIIQITHPKYSLRMGDVDVGMSGAPMHRINRRIQGVYAEQSFITKKGGASRIASFASQTRGIYTNEQINPVEGVQGPYRLQGASSSPFTIILAGTEKVYLDGKLLRRGIDQDYIIDYSLGEINFSSQELIRNESRIFVEYEYVENGFNRNLIASEVKYTSPNKRFSFNSMVSREADNNGFLAQDLLTESEIQLLKQAGDQTTISIDSGRPWIKDNDRSRAYIRVDTLWNDQKYTIYVKANDPKISESDLVEVQFTRVGDNEGDYRRLETGLNVPIYKWVGENRGDFTSQTQLPTPMAHQVVSFEGSYILQENIRLSGNWSLSSYDVNRYSVKDNEDNVGLAYQSGIEWTNNMLRADYSRFHGYMRKMNAQYKGTERIREVEYQRLFDLNASIIEEQVFGGEWDWQQNKKEIKLGLIHLTTGSEERIRQTSMVKIGDPDGISLAYQQDLVRRLSSVNGIGYWLRQKGTVGFPLKKGSERRPSSMIIGVDFEHEDQQRRRVDSDSLISPSQRFWSLGPSIMGLHNTWDWKASWLLRDEDYTQAGLWTHLSTAFEQRYRINWRANEHIWGKQEIHFRTRKKTANLAFVPNDEDGEQEDYHSTQKNIGIVIGSQLEWGQIDQNGKVFWDYNASTRRRSNFQEIYVYVGPELGQYVWIDDNQDLLQQITEFYPELSSNEGEYIKRLIPGDDYQSLIQVRSRLRYSWTPFQSRLLNRPLWQAIQLNLDLRISEDNSQNELARVLLLHPTTIMQQEWTVEGTLGASGRLEITPNSTGIQGLAEWDNSSSIHQRNVEVLQSAKKVLKLEGGYRFNEKIFSGLMGSRSRLFEYSDQLHLRNYSLTQYTIESSISARVNRSWNIKAILKHSRLNDSQSFAQEFVSVDELAIVFPTFTLQQWQYRMEQIVYVPGGIQARAQIAVQEFKSSDTLNPYIGYRLTEGMGTGRSARWDLNTQYRWKDWLELQVEYHGRTGKNGPAIHTLQISFNALF